MLFAVIFALLALAGYATVESMLPLRHDGGTTGHLVWPLEIYDHVQVNQAILDDLDQAAYYDPDLEDSLVIL